MERERSTPVSHEGEPGMWNDNEESRGVPRCGRVAHASIQPPFNSGETPESAPAAQTVVSSLGENGKSQGKRAILHVDMDAFFASIEQLYNPRLRGVPVLVCGDPDGRSVVATASYEARPYGIKCGMPVGQARKLCPHAMCVEGDPGKYV